MVSRKEDSEASSGAASKKMQEINNMMKPENISQTLRNFITLGVPGMVENFLDKVNMSQDGGQLLQAAIYTSQPEILKMLLDKGADLQNPPASVTPLGQDMRCHIDYRKSPYIVQAACAGNVDVIKMLITYGCKYTDSGHIALSKRRQNSVVSNVLGATAYHGHVDAFNYFTSKLGPEFLDVPAIETGDRAPAKSAPFKAELNGYSPLQLAIVGNKPELAIVKALFAKDANQLLRDAGTGNNILHLAAQNCEVYEVLEYLVKNAKVDLFERNTAGDTALTICERVGNARGATLITESQKVFDQSAKKTDELMAEILGEEDNKEKARAKRKEKKHRSKLQKLATQHGCTIDQLEQVFREQEEKKREEEKQKEFAALEAEREEELRVQRERQERLEAIERARAEELALIEEERRREREAAAKERALKLAKKVEQQRANREVEKKQQAEEENKQPEKLNRKQRKAIEQAERRRAEAEETARLAAERQARIEAGELDPDSEQAETANAVAAGAPEEAGHQPKTLGLTGELALQKAGKTARKKILEEQRREEEEREALKERIKKAKLDREQEAKNREKEERKRHREAEDLKKAEEKRKREQEREAAKLAKDEAKKVQKAEKAAAKRAQKAAEKILQEEEKKNETATPDVPADASEPISKKQAKKEAAPAADAAPEKEPKAKKSKKTAAEKKSKDAQPEMVYQAKKKDTSKAAAAPAPTADQEPAKSADIPTPEPVAPIEEEKKAPAPEAAPTPAPKKEKASKAADKEQSSAPVVVVDQKMVKDLEKARAELKELKDRMRQSEKAAQAEAKNLALQIKDLSAANADLREQLEEFQQESSAKTSTSERELQKQVSQLNQSLQAQVSVNKTLSTKFMIQEKALADEKRAKAELTKRLSAVLTSRPPAGPSSDELEPTYSGSPEDLRWMQSSLASVNQRVQHSLSQQQI